jgi:hypothetical protein
VNQEQVFVAIVQYSLVYYLLRRVWGVCKPVLVSWST